MLKLKTRAGGNSARLDIVGASARARQAWPSQQVKIVVPYIPQVVPRIKRAASSPRRDECAFGQQ